MLLVADVTECVQKIQVRNMHNRDSLRCSSCALMHVSSAGCPDGPARTSQRYMSVATVHR